MVRLLLIHMKKQVDHYETAMNVKGSLLRIEHKSTANIIDNMCLLHLRRGWGTNAQTLP